MADFEVFVTREAEVDLEEIADTIERRDSRERADYVYGRIRDTILKLETFPGRGRIVPELRDVGLKEYREAFFKPYRILYFISGKRVYVHCIFDGRRDVEDVLRRRFCR
ncbi:MAG: type II toxin-antitoxin system RelE/ParE family toxin [Vicinamibacteria bacterium]